MVAGASSGIGAATARALAAGGYTVALLARRSDRIAAIADEIGNGSVAIQADVTDRDSLVAAAERVQGRTARATNGVYAATKWGVNGWLESLRQKTMTSQR